MSLRLTILALATCLVAAACGSSTPANHQAAAHGTTSSAFRADGGAVLTSCFANPAGVGTVAAVQFPAAAPTPGVATWKAEVSFGGHVAQATNSEGVAGHATSYVNSARGGALPCQLISAYERVNGVWQRAQGAGAVMQPTGG